MHNSEDLKYSIILWYIVLVLGTVTCACYGKLGYGHMVILVLEVVHPGASNQ